MFMLPNYVCQNNLHVMFLNDSVINAKHNIVADDNWYHIDIIKMYYIVIIKF